VMAVFGAPAVHEDDAERALLSALRIPPAIDELNEEHPEVPLVVRIGIETGEAIVDLGAEPSRQGIVFGDVVNTASRLQTVAPSGRILVGEGTYRLTRNVFEFEAQEPVVVKGKADALRVWVATAARSRMGSEILRPSTTPWVDRDDELELIKLSFARSARESSVQVVTLIGEPGVGKSRLVREFGAYLDDRPDVVFWREGRCLPYGESLTFWALGEIVKAQAGVLASDGAAEAYEKLAEATAVLLQDPAEREWIRARLSPLVGVGEPQAEGTDRVETFSAWRRFLEAMAAIRPLVLVLEDIHWADLAMLAFVEHVTEWTTGFPILILCTARPELFDRAPSWGGGERNAITLSLPPLDEADTSDLVAALMPPETPDETVQIVASRAGGNPLFAEEFVRMLAEQPGTRPETQEAMTPATLHAIIAARLDRLTPQQKALLQAASVVGKIFWAGTLESMAEIEREALLLELHEMARKELIRPLATTSVKGEPEFSFWHSLIRDVAYGQIPRPARGSKHIAVAEWIERMAGERAPDRAELLAHHYGEALSLIQPHGSAEEVAPLVDSTRRYWVMAGDRAMGLDVAQATACFDHALALLPPAHPDEAGILARKAAAASDSGRFKDAQSAYESALELYRASGDRVAEGACLDKLATVLWEEGDATASRERLEEARDVLEREPPGPELADLYSSLASERMLSGRFEEALEWAERSLALLAELGNEHLRPRALSWRGVARCYQGDLGGIDDLHAAIALAERLGLAREQAKVLVILAEVVWATEGPARAIEAADSASRLATRRGIEEVVVACRTQTVGPLFDLGRWDDLLSVADDVISWSEAAGSSYDEITAQLWQARVMIWRARRSSTSPEAGLMSRAREIADPQVLVPAVVVVGLAALDDGRPGEAIDLVRELERAQDVGLGWYREHFLADLTRICVEGGDLSLASRLVDGAESFTRRHQLSLSTARAVLREGTGDLRHASGLYEEAARAWTTYGHVVEAGMASLGAARCLIRLGAPGGLEHLQRSTEVFASLGASRLLEDADRLTEEASTRSSSGP